MLEDKETRKNVLIELDELIEFAAYRETDASVAKSAIKNLVDA